MSRDPDEEALHWGDERDATHAGSARASDDSLDTSMPDADIAVSTTPSGVAQPDEDIHELSAEEHELADVEKASAPLSSAALVTIGFVGGVYLLYTIGWIVSVMRIGVPFTEDQLPQRVMYQIGGLLAIAAAPAWFLTTFLLTRRAIIRRGLVWLVIGLVVLVPLPMLLGV